MRLYIFCMLFMYSMLCFCQQCNYTLSGTVTDLHDDSILIGATITVLDEEKSTLADFDGKYSISGLCAKTYSIEVLHPSCDVRYFTIKISGNVTANFQLEHHIEQLNEVIINGKAYGDNSKTLSQKTITNSTLETYSNSSLGDALNTLSGISSLNTGNNIVKPIINGLHSSRIVIINNGVRMEDQEWGEEHAPNIDVNAAGGLTIIKGAAAVQYSGDAVGGIIVVEPLKYQVKDSLYGKTLTTISSNGRGTSLTSQLIKTTKSGWYGNVQGLLKHSGDFNAPNYILSNTGVLQQSFSTVIGLNKYKYGIDGYYSYFKNEIGILRASHLGGAEDQVRAINSVVPLIVEDYTYAIDAPKQDIVHHLARIKAFSKIKGLGKLSLQYDFQNNDRLEFDIRRGDDKDDPSLDLELKSHTILLDFDAKISDSLNFKTGVSAKYQNNFADPSTGVRRLIPDYDEYNFGVYAVADYQINDKWLLELGGRFDYSFIDAYKFYYSTFWQSRGYDDLYPDFVVEKYNTQVLTNPKFTYNNLSATFGAAYNFKESYKLLFNYSLASRAPNPSELFSDGLHQSASRIEIGDLQFQSEIGNKFSATLQGNKGDFSFSVNPYINLIKDFIVNEPTSVLTTIRGNFQVWEYRQTNAQLLGADIDASYNFSDNFSFKHQFSIVKGYDVLKDEPLISMPPVNTKNELIYQNIGFNNLKFSIESNYVFRQNEFPDNNFEVYLAETETTEDVDVSTPPDAYHLINIKASMDFNINKISKLSIAIGTTNLFNTSYRNYLNRLRYYADDLGRNTFLNIKINY
ncbi:TonB-dependent receptor [Cellulophaga tyrosinoxydans]|uniref:Iron complex outermembrane recepter protein n=1 Tax=Cellulophaga tyrosinoxydans TaxID=504486 RepID=A0A1W2BGL7_9FLAO|nr:TonB-dependent receptor [Cellulophaga tyrosinoxydans]SMC71984.1 iron complex outermembrane recepter protein [Cellulophaga tyrosinoxydans]